MKHLKGKSISHSTYATYKCRCTGCRAEHARYMREYLRDNSVARQKQLNRVTWNNNAKKKRAQ